MELGLPRTCPSTSSTPSDTPTEGSFTYEITGGNEKLKATISGDTLTVPATADAGEYTLTVTAAENAPQYALMRVDDFGIDPVELTVHITITQAKSTVSVSSTENPTYGSDIILTAAVAADGVDASLIGGTVTLKVGEDTLGDPVAVANGATALKIEGTNAALQKKLFGENGTSTISAEYSGTDNITSGTGTAGITIAKRSLTYTVTTEDKPEDGTTAVSVSLTPANLVGEDSITLTATGNVTKTDVGEYTTVDLTDITLSGADAKYYSVESSKTGVVLTAPVKIVKAAIRGTVTQSGTPVPDATVTLQQGNEIVASATPMRMGTTPSRRRTQVSIPSWWR